MDLTAFRTAIRTRLGVPSGDSFYTDTVLTDLTNAGIGFLSGEADWRWLEKSATIACVNADPDYAVPTDYRRTIAVIDADGVVLRRKPFDELQFMTTATDDTPHFFSIYGSLVHVRPVPNGTFNLTHYYVGEETALSAGTDTPALPTRWHDVAVEYAVYLAKMRAGNFQEADQNLQIYKSWVAVMKSEASAYAQTIGGGEEATPGA